MSDGKAVATQLIRAVANKQRDAKDKEDKLKAAGRQVIATLAEFFNTLTQSDEFPLEFDLGETLSGELYVFTAQGRGANKKVLMPFSFSVSPNDKWFNLVLGFSGQDEENLIREGAGRRAGGPSYSSPGSSPKPPQQVQISSENVGPLLSLLSLKLANLV